MAARRRTKGKRYSAATIRQVDEMIARNVSPNEIVAKTGMGLANINYRKYTRKKRPGAVTGAAKKTTRRKRRTRGAAASTRRISTAGANRPVEALQQIVSLDLSPAEMATFQNLLKALS